MPKNYDSKVYVVNKVDALAYPSDVPTNVSPGLSDVNNSTTTPLSSGATFTGTATRSSADQVSVSCKTDNTGTLYFDFSNDGTNWDAFPTSGFKIANGVHEYHTARVNGRQFRVRLVNDSGAQSYLRLYTYFGAPGLPSSPLNQSFGLDADSILTRSTLPWLDISRGLSSGITSIEKFGYNDSVGTSFVPICFGGVYRTPLSAESIEFVSSSTSDALNSTGMHSITIEGTDGNFVEQSVTTAAHATNGTVAVAVSGTWTRVHRAFVASSGTYANSTAGSHAGTITVRVSGGGATYAQIPLINSFPISQSLIGAYTIPSGKTGYVFLKSISADTGKVFYPAFFFRVNADDVSSSFAPMRIQDFKAGISGGAVYSGASSKVPLGPFVGPCDLGFMGYSSGGGGNASASVEFEVFLLDE